MSVQPSREWQKRARLSTYRKPKVETTNAYKAEHDDLFRLACGSAGCLPTRRQYVKWRQKRGLAYAQKAEAEKQILLASTPRKA